MDADVSDDQKSNILTSEATTNQISERKPSLGDAGKCTFKTPVSTPVNSQQLLSIDNQLIRSIDSGFSERSVFSSPDETPSSVGAAAPLVQCSSEVDGSVQGTAFSPVTHFPNRRASRVSLTTRPILQRLSRKVGSEDEVKGASAMSTTAGSNVSPGLTRDEGSDSPAVVRKVCEVESSSSLSSSTDELEMSLQEMSLEEFSSSSSTSPVYGIPLAGHQSDLPDFVHTSDPRMEEMSSDSSQNDDDENDLTILDVETPEVEATPNLSLPVVSAEPGISESPWNQDRFFKPLSLAAETPVSLAPRLSCKQLDLSPLGSQSDWSTSLKASLSGKASVDSRVPLLPHQYSLLDRPTPMDRPTPSFPTFQPSQPVSPVQVYYIPPACSQLLLSPGKRTGSSVSSDPEFDFVRSPTKTRRTNLSSSPVKSQPKKVRSPCKKLRDRSLADGSGVVRSIFSDHVSDLRSPLVKKKFDFGSSSSKKAIATIGYQSTDSDEFMPSVMRSHQKSPPTPSVSRSLQKSPRKFITRSPHSSPRKLNASPYTSPTKLISTSPYSSPRKLISMSPFSSPTKSITRSPFSSPMKVLSRSPQKSPRKLRLEKIIKEFSPKDPSRLIGRFTGAGKFDIIGELSQRGFLHCLQKVFSHLSGSDICSMCRVCSVWRGAVYNDSISVLRRQRFLSTHKLEMAFKGKENLSQRRGGSPGSLTWSKGELSTVQPQAQAHHHQQAQSPHKQTTMELLSSDTLRCCPHCQAASNVRPGQERAVCSSCNFDFCILCFSAFHGSRRCKPLCLATSTRSHVAGSRKSRKNLRRL